MTLAARSAEIAPSLIAAVTVRWPFSSSAVARAAGLILRSSASKDLPAGDPDEAAASVRELCGVISRKELDTQPTAAARWKQIDDAFWGWQRGLQ